MDNDDILTIGFTPSAPGGISSELALWLKADEQTFSDQAGNTAITTGTLQTWRDLSTRLNHVTQSTSSSRPTLVSSNNSENNLNYNPIVSFDGDDFLLVDDGLDGSTSDGDLTGITDTSDWEIFVVGYTDNTDSDEKTFLSFGSDADSAYSFFITGTTTQGVTDNNGNVQTTFSGGTENRANAEIYSWDFGDDNNSLGNVVQRTGYLTSTSLSSSNPDDETVVSENNISIGTNYISGSSSDQFEGDIAEVIIYAEDRSGTLERNRILTYLGIKYGIALTEDYYSSS